MQFQKDESLHYRFFAESLLYLYRNQTLYDDWYGVIIFPSRNLEPENTTIHRSLLNGSQVQCIYLDELGDPNQLPVGINLVQLTIVPEPQMAERAKQLIERVQHEETGILLKDEIIDVITTIVVYKFTNLSREEVEAMLGRSLEKSRVYQEAEAEGERKGELRGKLTAVPLLLKAGVSVEQIAKELELNLEQVQQIAQQQQA